MSAFVTKIHVNKVFHLENFEIELDPTEKKHLILTGKNGSGKTSLLNSLADFIQSVRDEPLLHLGLYLDSRDFSRRLQGVEAPNTTDDKAIIDNNKKYLYDIFSNVRLDFNHFQQVVNRLPDHDFILAYYSARRKEAFETVKSPRKPDLNWVDDIKQSKTSEFLIFLVDLKVQEALARNENQIAAAEKIRNWFIGFEALLNEVFEGEPVSLEFNYRDYSFTINQKEKKFDFNKLSDGYSAIIEIVTDLIIKMQDQNSLTRAYEKEGIVLIDEVETHLHLKLQRLIMPMLTRIFPNIQFIVTTHSPFVLSSLDNAIAYDLERRIRLEDLTEYSYEALAEGYFKVEMESGILMAKLRKFKALSENAERDAAEQAQYESLDNEFKNMDDALAPSNIKGQYLQIKLNAK
jgi:predicted ATP-dependent endonuclease of OLD family